MDSQRKTGRPISRKTVRHRLHGVRMFSRVARHKPLNNVVNRQKRVRWARRIQNWAVDHWSRTIFSDESRFNLSFNDGRVRCWRTPDEADHPSTQHPVTRSTVPVMVWGCMSIHGVGHLTVIDGNMDQFKYIDTLQKNLLS